MTHIDKLRAEIAADPVLAAEFADIDKLHADIDKIRAELRAEFRKMKPLGLKVAAWHDGIFPPESPTSKNRGGKKTGITPEMMGAVLDVIDAKAGQRLEETSENYLRAMQSGDVDFLARMAEAASYLKQGPSLSVFARHVIAARQQAAGMMGEAGPLPTWAEVRQAIEKQLGQICYGETSRDWGHVRKAAGLRSLPD